MEEEKEEPKLETQFVETRKDYFIAVLDGVATKEYHRSQWRNHIEIIDNQI